MRGKLFLLTFIFLLPAFAALGHDLYIAYGANEEKLEQLQALDINPGQFHLSDIGHLWVVYAPDSLNDVRSNVSLSTWENFIAPLLEQTAVIVALVPVILLHFINAIMWMLGLGAYAGSRVVKSSAGKEFSVYDKHKEKKAKYGRK